MGMLALHPGDSQMLFSPGHQQRSIVIISPVYIHCGAGPAVVLWRQCRLTWPKCLMCMPTKSTVAKARLVLTARASFPSRCSVEAGFTKPVVGCNTMVCIDARRDLSFSCLVAGPWGSAVVSATPVHWDHPQACALKVPVEPMSLP